MTVSGCISVCCQDTSPQLHLSASLSCQSSPANVLSKAGKQLLDRICRDITPSTSATRGLLQGSSLTFLCDQCMPHIFCSFPSDLWLHQGCDGFALCGNLQLILSKSYPDRRYNVKASVISECSHFVAKRSKHGTELPGIFVDPCQHVAHVANLVTSLSCLTAALDSQFAPVVR